MQGFLRTYADTDLQPPMDAAVVIPTVLRPSLTQALHSVFAQDFPGRIHILVGIDAPRGDLAQIDAACAARPPNCAVQVFWPGYSTAVRNGGLTPPGDGGALRCILTYLANSPYVAYLDDDNWWDPAHLTQMRQAIDDADWAFALRWFVHPVTRRPVCVDTWESLGPDQGLFKETFGGFVDPSCLMINKVTCPLVAPHWNFPLAQDPMSADRNVFAFLKQRHRPHGTGNPTVFYTLNAKDGLHPMRLRLIGPAYDAAGS
ncbi:MAG TPA: glycosyltransferase family 2 protein [Rhodopila sp.]|nr:glycosyltransferase family 2 protein [Rhodopila sp.]